MQHFSGTKVCVKAIVTLSNWFDGSGGSSRDSSSFASELDLHVCMILCHQNRMSDTTDSTEQLPTMPGTDGCAPSVDDGNDVTTLMHKGTVQEVASNKDGTVKSREQQ